MPGEFRDVDVPGGAIRDSITFIPYKEPSSVLSSYLQYGGVFRSMVIVVVVVVVVVVIIIILSFVLDYS